MIETPTFTKVYLGCNIALALMVFSTTLDPYSITYSFKLTFMELSLYRPITALLYLSRISILFPIHLFFAYVATSRVSTLIHPPHRLYDLAWFVTLFTISLMLFSTLVANLYFYGSAFVMGMLVVWGIQHPTNRFRIGAEINSVYFPLVYAVIMIALGSNYKNYVGGLLIGLAYGIVKSPSFVRQHGDTLPTPLFYKTYLRPHQEQQEYQPPQPRVVNPGQDYFRGMGVRLG